MLDKPLSISSGGKVYVTKLIFFRGLSNLIFKMLDNFQRRKLMTMIWQKARLLRFLSRVKTRLIKLFFNLKTFFRSRKIVHNWAYDSYEEKVISEIDAVISNM